MGIHFQFKRFLHIRVDQENNMSINTAHTENGVLLHAAENIILFCDNVTMDFYGEGYTALPRYSALKFKGDKSGRLYLTTHRMIFNSKKQDLLKSVSFPFV